MWKIIGFDINSYDLDKLNAMTDVQKNELYLSDDENTCCWDSVKDFFNDMNDDVVDTENIYYFLVNT